ncbi:EF-hand domain-containing protein [Nonomuraea guangzhouensis]|uniref:EF-hand domain-containing protein n=1 Tax=Nonomuraea guangzhouensis TaxID=1291555 RepID=A0ABW4G6M9_9ACTN|nr:EF-hand domain-containing protein [Nonomuraea guangzhouensis]
MTSARDAAKAEFERFDTDGDGLLSTSEIRQVNAALGGHGVDDGEISAFIDAADKDGDGRIGLEEFIALVGGGKHEA